MTFNPGIPVQTQSPGLFPAQMQADLGRLQTIIEADHVFNNTAASNDGIHKQVKMLNRTIPTGPLVNGESGIHFSVANSLGQSQEWYYNGTALYLPETALKCMVNFNGVPAVPVVRTGALNITSVTRRGVGRYTVTYAVPFVPNANGQDYVVQLNCMKVGTNLTVAQISSETAFNLAMTHLYVNVDTYDRSGSHVNCDYIGVTIHSWI